MKREIKFRAWDKNTERMWDIETWHIADEYVDLIEPGKSIADINAERFWRKQSEIILMEYTGLHDKNGRDIFEGDIVHCENDYEGTDYTGKVMFFNGGFCVWTGGFRNYVWDDMISEVIGNIHENAELLEEEK